MLAKNDASHFFLTRLYMHMMQGYFLDGASAIAAAAMNVEPGASVLDLCAAPGGKSVMLASILFAGGHLLQICSMALHGSYAMLSIALASLPSASVLSCACCILLPLLVLSCSSLVSGDSHGRLVSNEMSRPRLQRLQRVLSSFLPAEMLNAGLLSECFKQ